MTSPVPGRHRSAARAAAASVLLTGGRATGKAVGCLLGGVGLVVALVVSPAVAEQSPASSVPAGATALRASTTTVSAPQVRLPAQPSFGLPGLSAVAKPKPKPLAIAGDRLAKGASRSSTRIPVAARISGIGTGGLTGNAKVVLAGVTWAFPEIRNVIGVRPDSIPDHPSGHAIDFMVPDPFSSSGVALGTSIVATVQAHAGEWHVKYLIYRQRIWFPGSGWRGMSDRGSPTANHMDHVHVTVN